MDCGSDCMCLKKDPRVRLKKKKTKCRTTYLSKGYTLHMHGLIISGRTHEAVNRIASREGNFKYTLFAQAETFFTRS